MKSRIWKMTTWRPSPRFRSLQFFIYAVQWSGELFPIDEHNHCKLLTCKRILHPRRPRGGQSGREKRRDKRFQEQAKKPLGTDSHRTISKRSRECWFLIGHKNALYYCGFSACAWKLLLRLFSRPDWPPLVLRGCAFSGMMRVLIYFSKLTFYLCGTKNPPIKQP